MVQIRRTARGTVVPAVVLLCVAAATVMLLGSWGPAPPAPVALAGKAAKGGKKAQADVVASMLRRSLKDDVSQQEGKLYARALQKGGLHLDDMAKKAVAAEVTSAKHTAATLAIDDRLQKNVKLASTITSRAAHRIHRSAAASEAAVAAAGKSADEASKLELAEKILTEESAKASSHPRPAAAAPAAAPKPVVEVRGGRKVVVAQPTMKEALTRSLDSKASTKLDGMEHPRPAKKARLLTASQVIYRSLKERLDANVQHSEATTYTKDLDARLSRHPDLAQLAPAKPRRAPAAAAKQQSLAAGHVTVRDSAQMTNKQLEDALKAELDHNVGAALRNAETPKGEVVGSKTVMQLVGGKAGAVKAAARQQLSNVQLEHALRRKLDDKVSRREAAQAAAIARDPKAAAKKEGGAGKAAKGKGKGGLPSNYELELAMRAQLNGKAHKMAKAMYLGGMGVPKAKAEVAKMQPKETKAQQAKDAERRQEYAMEAKLRGELNEGVEDALKADDEADLKLQKEGVTAKPAQRANMAALGKDETGLQHAGERFGRKAAGVAKPLSENAVEATLRAQLNARVAAKERKGEVH